MARRRGLHIALASLAVVGALIAIYFVITVVQVWRVAESDDRSTSQAIVVLGAAQYDGRPSPVFQSRLDHALDLWKAGVAPIIVVTGGKQLGDRFTESSSGANYLLERGVPDTAILRETTSRNSWESLAAASIFLKADGITRVTLVSDPFHMLRTQLIAEDLGLSAITSPTDSSPISGLDEFWQYLSESARVSLGRIFGFDVVARATRTGVTLTRSSSR